MKVNHQKLISEFLSLGCSWPRAYRKSSRAIRDVVKVWGGSILVFFGPPHSGKSSLISRFQEDKSTLIIETFGTNTSLNSLLLHTPLVEFCEVKANPKDCIKSIIRSEYNKDIPAIEVANFKDILIGLVNKYSAMYNVGSKKDNRLRLPQTRHITRD
jgi:hypothetical protein